MPRLPFTVEHLEQLSELWDEAVQEIAKNFEDDRFDDTAPREITLKAVFIPDKDDPADIKVHFRKKLKIPDRKGKLAFAALRDGVLLMDRVPEQDDIFAAENEKVRPIRREEGGE
jgi:hypothetical protein